MKKPELAMHVLEYQRPMPELGIALSMVLDRGDEPPTVDVKDINGDIGIFIARLRAKTNNPKIRAGVLRFLSRIAAVPMQTMSDSSALGEALGFLRDPDNLPAPFAAASEDDIWSYDAQDLLQYFGHVFAQLNDFGLASIDMSSMEDVPSQHDLIDNDCFSWVYHHTLTSGPDTGHPHTQSAIPFGCVLRSYCAFPKDPHRLLQGELACALSLLRRRADYPSSLDNFNCGNSCPQNEIAPSATILTFADDKHDSRWDRPIYARAIRASVVSFDQAVAAIASSKTTPANGDRQCSDSQANDRIRRTPNAIQAAMPFFLIEVGETIDFSSVHRCGEWTDADRVDWADKVSRLMRPLLDPQIAEACPLYVDPLSRLKQQILVREQRLSQETSDATNSMPLSSMILLRRTRDSHHNEVSRPENATDTDSTTSVNSGSTTGSRKSSGSDVTAPDIEPVEGDY